MAKLGSTQIYGTLTLIDGSILDVDGFTIASTKSLVFTDGGSVNVINTTFVDNDTSLMTSQAIKEKITIYGYSTTTGTVTSVGNGNGMNFTTITGSGTVTLGTPSACNGTSTSAVTTSSHTHAISLTYSDVGAEAANANIQSHITNTSNPHSVDLSDFSVTSTAAELNKLDGVTATTAELNIIDGVTSTTAELNTLDGFSGTKDDLNYAKLLRATGVTHTEFNWLDGVTSNIQTQLDAKNIPWIWRNSITSVDFDKNDFVDTASVWHDLDLSSIVGSQASEIILRIYCMDTGTLGYCQVRTNGISGTYSRSSVRNQVLNVYQEVNFSLLTDSDGKIEYVMNPKPTSWTNMTFIILAYRKAQ